MDERLSSQPVDLLDAAEGPGASASPSRNASARAITINALSGYLTLGLGAAAGAVSTPVLLHALGATRFGTYQLLLATAAYLGLLEIGLGTATVTRTASVEHDGTEGLSVVLSSSVLLFTFVGALMLVITGVVSLLIPSLYSLPRGLHEDALVAFLFIGAAQAVTSTTTAFTAFLIGTGRLHVQNLLGFVVSFATTLGTIVCALIAPALTLIAAVQLVGAVVAALSFRLKVRRILAAARPRLRQARAEIVRHLLRLGWRNAIASVMGSLAFGSDLVLVGLLLSPRAAASYAIALSAYAFLLRFTTTALGATGPAHAHRAATGSADSAFELLSHSAIATSALAILCGLPVAVFAHALLGLWLGGFPPETAVIVLVLCLVLLAQPISHASAVYLTSSEQASVVMRITTLSALVNVLASVALTASIGVLGPALGSLLAICSIDLFWFPSRACRALGRRPRELTATLKPLVLPTIAFSMALGGGKLLVSSGILVLPVVALSCTVFVAVALRDPLMRTRALKLIGRVG